MGVMRVLNRHGDTEFPWDPKVKNDVATAESFFREQLSQGLLAWETDVTGRGSDQLKTFKPAAREIIFTRRLVGG